MYADLLRNQGILGSFWFYKLIRKSRFEVVKKIRNKKEKHKVATNCEGQEILPLEALLVIL